MRSVLLVMLAASVATAETPVDAIARAKDGTALHVQFDAKACTLDVGERSIPLRKVTWSMTKDGDNTAVTARCPAKSACIGALPRYTFYLAAPPADARKRFGELKKLVARCT